MSNVKFHMSGPDKITVKLNRDSVHAGDDLDSHVTMISISKQATVSDLLKEIRYSGFLPGIAGGKATWIVDCSNAPNGTLGVMAQQWDTPKLTVSTETEITQLELSDTAGLYFRYWCQADPEVVFSCVRTGKELPDKYR